MTAQLYNDAILAEAKARHGHGRLAAPAVSVTCDNPLCGDRVTVDLEASRWSGRRVRANHPRLRPDPGRGLGARAAIWPGRRRTTCGGRRQRFGGLLAGDAIQPAWPELAMFAPVQAVKSRHECVLLPFEAAAEALAKASG